MSVRHARTRYHVMVVTGATIAIAGSVIGAVRMFGLGGEMVHGMPMSDMPEMVLAGGGILLALAGALLRGAPRTPVPATKRFRGRGLVAFIATTALTIDISKTSTLGFVIPGMRAEYGLGPTAASMLAVAGLSGTATGALLFSRLADRVGRRLTYVIATLGFTATSLCAGMPTFGGNVVMCFLMGITVGGLAPLLITMLTDLFPGGARGPVVTGLSVVATAVGFLVASGSALWLEPVYGWRMLWLIGAPTGLLLTLAAVLVPQRAPAATEPSGGGTRELDGRPRRIARAAFTIRLQWLYAAVVGLMTFGLTTWVPTLARAGDLAPTTANTLLTAVAVAMVPGAVLVAVAYRRFGTIPLAVAMATGTAALLLGLVTSGVTAAVPWLAAAMLAGSLFAVNTLAAIFLPIAADLAGSASRGRVTGTVSFSNRIGGLTGPLALSLIVSSVTDVLTAVAVLALCCGAIAWYTGHRHRAVRADLEREARMLTAPGVPPG
ncbi:MFS transporter, putative metabolite:H+ symporter [Amycolatopsis arida]|uniref:MFS transporter, putative metabolite:H+ symporter n=1 Tax=Amycolatopsis arida TaxID=587909 RepID=A0A1I6AQR8_9PSEU|nr:MFS transporter [Amycolatopsis arida]TDX97609.1 putative MFS transporter [Amycolatopsis arida]SFQ71004.1 MFS transporter, putative metabolite:H+ symporter [Amycolatopsis arida]